VPLPYGKRELEQMSFGSDMIYDFRMALLDPQYKEPIEYLKKNGNPTLQGNVVCSDSNSNIVINQSDKVISLLGMDNFAVIQTDDAILICPQDKSAQIQGVLDRLAETENRKLL